MQINAPCQSASLPCIARNEKLLSQSVIEEYECNAGPKPKELTAVSDAMSSKSTTICLIGHKSVNGVDIPALIRHTQIGQKALQLLGHSKLEVQFHKPFTTLGMRERDLTTNEIRRFACNAEDDGHTRTEQETRRARRAKCGNHTARLERGARTNATKANRVLGCSPLIVERAKALMVLGISEEELFALQGTGNRDLSRVNGSCASKCLLCCTTRLC